MKNDDEAFIVQFERVIKEAQLSWHEPHTVAHDDEISHEWYHDRRCLTVFEQRNEVEMIKIWGHRINEDMAFIDEPTDEELISTWKWLQDG